MNQEDLASAPSSSACINTTLLSLLLNVVKVNFRISRGGHLLPDGNPKGYELSEHIATKVKVNERMI